MAIPTQDLRNQTLAQLEALRSTLASADWQIRMMGASAEQKQENSDVRILADARIAQLEDLQLDRIEAQIDANAAVLNGAIAGVQDALADLQDVPKPRRGERAAQGRRPGPRRHPPVIPPAG